jgi:REP element-mobilizing transposase RayT
MNTYTQILYHIVFSPGNHEKTLATENRQQLYKYIWGILKNKKWHLYRIGGMADHIHIVTHIHPTVSLASLGKDIKLASSEYIKDMEELIELLNEHEIEFDKKYLL